MAVALSNVPLPFVVQIIPPASVKDPAIGTTVWASQMAISEPALTVGGGISAITIVSLMALHEPLPMVVAVI